MTKMRKLGYIQCEHEPCLFYKVTRGGKTIVSLSSDDLLVAASTDHLIKISHSGLSVHFDVKRIGFPELFLGCRVYRNELGHIHLSQQTLIQKADYDLRPRR